MCIIYLNIFVTDNAELGIDDIVETLRFLTRESIFVIVAGEGGLIEYGLVTAHEGELSVFFDLTGFRIFNWEANVENIAVIVYVGVVSGKEFQIILVGSSS